MGSGGSQTVSNTPWGGQAPYLSNQYQQGGGLYQGGVGYNPFPGPTYAGLDPLQKQGMGMIQQAALDPNSAGNQAGTTLGGIMRQGPYTPSYLAPAMQSNVAGQKGLNKIASANYNEPGYLSGATQGYTPSYLGGAMAQNNAGVPDIQNAMTGPYAQQMQQTSQGGYLGGNAALNDVYNTAARRATETYQQTTMPGIRAGAQGAGMGASSRNALAQGQATGMYGQGLQDLAGQIYAPAYENERNRMLQAAQAGQAGQFQGAGMLQTGQENYLNRLGMGASLQGQLNESQRARQMQAAQQQLQALGMLQSGGENNLNRLLSGAGQQSQNNQFNTNAQMQAAQIAPQTANWGAQQLMNLGGINQQQNQNELTGMQNYWNQYNQAPWQRLGAYTGAATGGGTPGGNQTQSSGGSSLLGGLGGAATGAGIAGALPTAFMASNPWMWPLLIGGGGAAGLLG